MSFDQYEGSVSREVAWLVVLHLDYCSLTFGQGACQAAGACCYYTYPTCKDPVNFSRTVKEHLFCRAGETGPEGALPYLADIKTVPTEITPKKNVTRRARVTLSFFDDEPMALANPDKSVSNTETSGTFFKNLLARNPNAAGRKAEIFQGFAGLPAEDYRLVMSGVIERIECGRDGARVIIKDRLKMLDKKIPPRQSSGNVLTAAYNGESRMNVADGSEFEPPGTVKVDDEYVDFEEVEADALVGCTPGAYGSGRSFHQAGGQVKQVAAFAEPADGSGLPPDELMLSLICDHGGIDPLCIKTVDRGASLSAGVQETDMALPLDSTDDFPETGVVRLDDELVRYRGISGSGLVAHRRGAYGTLASSHQKGTPVLVTSFSDELGRWMSGTLYRRFVEQGVKIKDLVNELRKQCLLHVWQTEDSAIAAKCIAPPLFGQTPPQLDDRTGFINGSTSWSPAEELLSTRITVHYAPNKPDAGKDPQSYSGLLVLVDADAEREEFFGEEKNEEVWSNWIYREHEAVLLASRFLIRFGRGASVLRFALELKDSSLAVGDFLRVTTSEVTDPSGAPSAGALFEVLKKKRVSDNRVEYTAMDTRLDKRYPVISPPTVTGDYDSAEDELRQRHGWIGDADNKVGRDQEEGYYVY